MTAEPASLPARPPAVVDIAERFGWRTVRVGALTLRLKGNVYGTGLQALAGRLAARGADAFAAEVAALDGHFALAVEAPGWAAAATDRIGSVPLFVHRARDGAVITDDPVRLGEARDLGGLDSDAALCLGMAGYTIGGATLFEGLERLAPGEAVVAREGAAIERRSTYVYRPWLAEGAGGGERRRALARLTLELIGRMAETLDGRPILVPLSAGLDSRLIASALKVIGYKDVRCFAYGRPGNFEAAASRRIAERLGFRWRFVPYSARQQAATFASELGRGYARYADTLSSIPFQQDLHAVGTLRESGFAPAEAVFVNGQSGDYISGNHIAPAFAEPAPAGEAARWARILDAAVDKHFSLWGVLKTPETLAKVHRLLRDDLSRAGAALGEPEEDFALYELSELRNRQSKYTVAGQRTYEYLGFEWRLPLWDNAYLDFWERVPFALKFRQRLYREMLEAEDWGGVWGTGWSTPRVVSPGWIRLLRLAAKAAHAPLGHRRWHAFERRVFAWWMDVTANYAVVPYRRVLGDRRGQRNAISWHAEAYLAGKGLALDGRTIGER